MTVTGAPGLLGDRASAAVGPVARIEPTSIAFGDQPVGTVSAGRTVTLANTGDAPFDLMSVAFPPPDFRLLASSCQSGIRLDPGRSCANVVAFSPTGAGPRTGTMTFHTSAPGGPQTVTLAGNGTTPSPAASFVPSSVSFGDQPVGTTSASQTLEIRNSGDAPLLISALGLAGSDRGHFQIRTNSCGGSVAPGASCTVAIAFVPMASGARSATLMLSSNAAGSPHSAALTGNGTAPSADLRPASIDFGAQALGTSGDGRSVTVTNTGDATLGVSSVGLAGEAPGDFRISSDTCSGATGIAPGAECAVSLVFTPTATGSRAATLRFVDNAPGSPHLLPLTGTGVVPSAPAVALSATNLQFGEQPQGTTGGSRSVTVTNTGNATLSVSDVALSGSDGGDFSIGHNTCATGSIDPGADCSISVAFTPTTTGPRSATLVLTDDAPGSPHTVALTGTGVLLADVGVSIGATPNPVRTGTTLTYTITVTNFGPSPATGVVLTETLPSGSKFVGYTANAGTTCKAPAPGATGTLTCALGSVPVGSAAVQVQVKVVAPGGTSVTNTVKVTSSSGDPNPANDSATVSTSVFGRK